MGSDEGAVSGALLEVTGVRRSFGPTKALVDASLSLRRGQVLALVGENGSGKSTLVKILTGVHKPDAGALRLDGADFEASSPKDAADLGIVTVYQEILIAKGRSVLENVWLGAGGFLAHKTSLTARRQIADHWIRRLVGSPLDLDAPAGRFSVSIQQAMCIVRALIRHPKVLILDEATSALDVETRDNLFAIVRERSKEGTSTIIISHRMDEVIEIADASVVLRSGATVGQLVRSETSPARLVQLMTGSEHLVPPAPARVSSPSEFIQREAVLIVEKLIVRPGAAPINLTLRRGEIVGLGGLEGHGQDLFLDLLAAGSRGGEVSVRTARGVEAITTRRTGLRARLAYVPRDRRAEGIFPHLSTRLNFAVPTLSEDTRWFLLRSSATRRRFNEYISALRIKVGDDDNPITSLSGGNQQKVVISRWLATDPSVLILSDPTRGIDLNAKRDIYSALRALAARGVGILMLSSEVDELVELMDRVVVFREGSIFAEIDRGDLTNTTLVARFFGHGPGGGRSSVR